MKQSFSRILNYIGLTIAFVAFLVIMVQVDYETSFCSTYNNTERTYRVEVTYTASAEMQPVDNYMCVLSRPMIEVLKDAPVIESYSRILGDGNMSFYIQDAQSRQYQAVEGIGMIICNKSTIDMMNIEFLSGQDNVGKMDEVLDQVFLSDEMTSRLYGDEDPIGKTILYNNQWGEDTLRIGGVFKEMTSNGIAKSEMIIPYGDHDLDHHDDQSVHFFITLREGVTKEEATQSISEYADKYVDSMRGDSEGAYHIRLTAIEDIHFTTDVDFPMVELANRSTLYSLITVAIILLLVAMVNFWNIAMASIPSRIKNINTRMVLGASREELIGFQMLETIIIAVVAFISAVFVLYLLSKTSIADLVSDDINPLKHWKFIATTGIVAVFVSALAGLSPAIYSTSFAPALVLKGGFSHNIKGRKLRNILIGFQFVVSLILGIFAMFVNVQSNYMQSYDKGFKSGDVLYSVLDRRLAHKHLTLAERMKKHPEIEDVTFSSREFVAMGGIMMRWERAINHERAIFRCLPVERNFLEFFDFNKVDGRFFDERDETSTNARYVFNKAALNAYNIQVGTKFYGYSDDEEVVGICDDFHCRPLQYDVEPSAFVFSQIWMGDESWENMVHCYIKRAHGVGINEVYDILKFEIMNIDNGIPQELVSLCYFDQTIGGLYDKESNLSTLTLIACMLSVLIAIIGILGLVHFETQYRRKEIAIRRVMGASISALLKMFNGIYVRLCLICFVVAIPIAIVVIIYWLRSYAYQSPIPVWIFISALAVLLLIVVTTITVTSLRAISRNPVESIKRE